MWHMVYKRPWWCMSIAQNNYYLPCTTSWEVFTVSWRVIPAANMSNASGTRRLFLIPLLEGGPVCSHILLIHHVAHQGMVIDSDPACRRSCTFACICTDNQCNVPIANIWLGTCFLFSASRCRLWLCRGETRWTTPRTRTLVWLLHISWVPVSVEVSFLRFFIGPPVAQLIFFSQNIRSVL